MIKIKFFLIVVFLAFFNLIKAQYTVVSNVLEYNEAIKSVSSGGTIILKNGVWADVNLEAFGNGTKANPVIIKAETPGQVIITGDSSLKIYGTYVIVLYNSAYLF